MIKPICKSSVLFAIFLLLINITSCKTVKNQFFKDSKILQPGSFSHRTVIVYLENGTSEEEINALCKKYKLQVLYIYKSFSSCALSSQETLTDKELDELIKKVKSEPLVLDVQKDYIMSLDSDDS